MAICPNIPFLTHASVICRFSGWFRTQFEAHERQQEEAKANGTDLDPGTWHDCTLHIPNCDPEVFEMYLNWQYKERFPIPITMPREDEEDYDFGYPYTYWYENEYMEGDWEGDKEGDGEKTVADYYSDALLFLTKAYVLGRRMRDHHFQSETLKVIREMMGKIMLGNDGLKRGMEAFEKASKIVEWYHNEKIWAYADS